MLAVAHQGFRPVAHGCVERGRGHGAAGGAGGNRHKQGTQARGDHRCRQGKVTEKKASWHRCMLADLSSLRQCCQRRIEPARQLRAHAGGQALQQFTAAARIGAFP